MTNCAPWFNPLGQRAADLAAGQWTDYVATAEGDRIAALFGAGPNPPALYFRHGALGTTRALTDQNGANLASCGQNAAYPNGGLLTYAPFGGPLDCAQSLTPFGFGAHPRDPESGLDFLGARYYSPLLGRFLSPDWSADPEPVPYADLENPQTLNLYSYAANSPVTFGDPDGHILGCCLEWLGDWWNSLTAGPPAPNCGNPCNVVATPLPADTFGTDPLSQAQLATAERESQGAGKLIQQAQAHPNITMLAVGAIIPGGDFGEAAELLDEAANSGAQSPALIRAIRELFRATDKVPGGTAGAVRRELSTGEMVGEKFHSEKAINTITENCII